MHPPTLQLEDKFNTPYKIMKKIQKIISTELRTSKYHKKFFLSEVVLEDNETYSLASSKKPLIGDEVENYFSDKWNKPIASYPQRPKN